MDEEKLLGDFLSIHENVCNMIRCTPEKAASVIAEPLQVVDGEFIQEVFAVSPRYCASLPKEYIESTMKFVPVLQKMGHLQETLSVDRVFNPSLIEKIHPGPQHYYP
jgi:NitT/TauT family transport system substrate-binding protein